MYRESLGKIDKPELITLILALVEQNAPLAIEAVRRK